MNIAEQRRRIVETSRWEHHRGLPASCTLGYSLIDQSANAIQLHGRDDCADVNCFIERRPGAKSAHTVPDFSNQRLSDTFLHQQARTCAADLSLVQPDAIY